LWSCKVYFSARGCGARLLDFLSNAINGKMLELYVSGRRAKCRIFSTQSILLNILSLLLIDIAFGSISPSIFVPQVICVLMPHHYCLADNLSINVPNLLNTLPFRRRTFSNHEQRPIEQGKFSQPVPTSSY
jgi:hypothetical protein